MRRLFYALFAGALLIGAATPAFASSSKPIVRSHLTLFDINFCTPAAASDVGCDVRIVPGKTRFQAAVRSVSRQAELHANAPRKTHVY